MSGLLDLKDIQPELIERAQVPFGEWKPDRPEYASDGATEALNVIPAEGCYVPFPKLVPNLAAVAPDEVRSATAVLLPTNVVQLYIGTPSALYTRIGATFINILAAPTSEDLSWQWVRVNEQMVAIHPQHVPVRSPVETSTPMITLGGDPPIAACGAQVGDFLVLGNLISDPDDFDSFQPYRIRWSGFNNIDSAWVSSPITQADFQDRPSEGGPIIALSGRDYGTIFQTKMIGRMTYQGPPTIFDIATIEDKRGAIARDSVVDVGLYQFFIAEDGFFIWNGTNSNPIGDGRINRYFFNRLEYSKRHRIRGAVDFVSGCVMWAFPTDNSGELNEIVIYSYRENKWAHSIQTLEVLFSSAASNITLEELTDPLESYTESFDSSFYRQGGRSRLAAFNDAHTYGLFAGLPMAAIIDTAEYSGPDGRRAFVNSVRPMVDLPIPYATVQLARRDQMQGQPLSFTDPVTQELDGQCPVIGDARYMRFRVNIPDSAPWQHAMGVEVARKATGQF